VTTEEEVEVTAAISDLESRLQSLRRAALLTELNDDLEDLDTALSELPLAIEQLRSRGYVFKGYLENKARVLQEQWDDIRQRVVSEIDRRSRDLSRELERVEREVSRLHSGSSMAAVNSAQRAVAALADRIEAAEDAIEGMFDKLERNVSQTEDQIAHVNWMLDQIDAASFRLYPNEAPIEAVEAQWLTDGKEGPKGILYLTDHRLLFEQKEEIAKKKILFITTEKELVQELRLEVPVGQIQEVQESEKGFLFAKKELLDLAFSGDAPYPSARFVLKGDSEAWKVLIGRVLSGEIDKERTTPPEEAPAAPPKEIPTHCPTCGALITQEIVKGMVSITCEYCGTVIRL